MTRKLIETLHSSAIFFDENKDMWRTTISVTEGGSVKRKHFSAKTEESLYNKLYDYYIGPGSLADIHGLWAEQRKQENLAAATLHLPAVGALNDSLQISSPTQGSSELCCLHKGKYLS